MDDSIKDKISQIKKHRRSRGLKIKTKFTREMMIDINMMHGIDVSAELESILVSELKNSIK